MKTQEYGEVVVVFEWEDVPIGMVLREVSGKTVLLEEYYGNGNADVLCIFEKCDLSKKEDFAACIHTAREYAEDENATIYIISPKVTSIP